MSEKNTNAVIDLGSNKLRGAIFNFDKQESKLTAYSEIKTLGINNSLITNFDEACKSIRKIIADLEKKAGANINMITVMLEPTEIITTRITKFKKMEGIKIESEDINFLLRESKKQLEKNDKTFSQLHMFNFKYIIDNKIFKELPIDIFCNQLSLENIFVSVPKNILKNIREVFNSCNMEVNKFICPSYATGIYLLNNSQLENGSGVVDVGYNKI
jgi:cell division protein FtsA